MRAYVSVFQDEDGWWIAEVLNMRGCVTQAKTRVEVLERIRQVIPGWLEVMREDWPDVVAQIEAGDVEELEIAA